MFMGYRAAQVVTHNKIKHNHTPLRQTKEEKDDAIIDAIASVIATIFTGAILASLVLPLVVAIIYC